MENCDQRVIIFFALCPLSYAIIRGVISGKKVMSGKLQKELAEMNRKTTTLYVLVVLAMVTLALPTPSYPSNAFSGFAEGRVCLKSRSSAARISHDLRFDLSSFETLGGIYEE